MPIFSRRRLQLMLDELSYQMPVEKVLDILKRLENKRVEQALPAEMELGLLWALSKLGEIDIEPEWWGDSARPDAVTESLVPDRCVAIEIAATTDNALSGEEAMDNIALQMSDFANTVKKGVGEYLYFTFGGDRGFENGRSVRLRLAPERYVLTDSVKRAVQDWIVSGQFESEKLLVAEPSLHVVLEKRRYRQTRYHNVFSSIPPEAYFIDKNPLAELLKRKLKQLKATSFQTLRIIFVADVGSTLLNQIGTFGEQHFRHYKFSGTDIVSHFVRTNSSRVDAVVAFTPRRQSVDYRRDSIVWAAHSFASDENIAQKLQDRTKELLSFLPRPHFEGYQARSLFQQGAFSPQARGWYLGLNMKWENGETTVSVSARLFLDLLAGRITPEQFRHFKGDKPGEIGLFGHLLDRGLTLKGIEMAERDVDADDDYIVLHFSDDPAARQLRTGQEDG